MSSELKAIAILVSTTIGAGMFAVPYAISKIGFIPGTFYLLILGILILLLNLIYGEVTLRTPGDHQMNGYVRIYLGKKKEFLNVLSTTALFISLYGALLAYLIKIGEFLGLLFGSAHPVFFSIFFFFLASLILYSGLKMVSSSALIMAGVLLISIVLLFILGANKIDMSNFSGINTSYLFFPYGIILFALTGTSVIPEMEEILRKEPKKLKRSIIIGSLVPLFTYLVFAVLVVGLCGDSTSDDAVSGLLIFLPTYVVRIGAFLGVLTMGSSFLAIVYILKETWLRDFKFSNALSLVLTCLPPLLLFLLGSKSFIGVLSFSGAVSGGLMGMLILSMFKKAKKQGKRKPAFCLEISNYLILFLYLIFSLGIFSPFIR